jgi:hypothetical protein
MTRWIICAIVLAWAVAGCSGRGADGGSGESLASIQQAATSCKSYDGYTAALAEATIDCLGAIGPFDYTTDAQGALAPAFDKCTQPEPQLEPPRKQVPTLVRIKRLLSLQDGRRKEFAPLALGCVRDAYLAAAQKLVGGGVSVCPNWHKVFAGGVPSQRNAIAISKRLPVPHFNDKQIRIIDPPRIGSGFRFPKEYFFYTVSFDDQQPPADQSCGGAVTCARACAGLFEGFFVGRFGKYIVGDPFWWLDPTDYGGFDSSNDPYSRFNGYYHPMSLAGADVPGEIYGDFARAAFEDPFAADIEGAAEECTRWNGKEHVMARLIQDRAIDVPELWMSRCEFYP